MNSRLDRRGFLVATTAAVAWPALARAAAPKANVRHVAWLDEVQQPPETLPPDSLRLPPLLIDADGQALDARRPSAEALLHASIYRLHPDVNAVLHPHSPNATLASRLFSDAIILEDYELLKALDNITTHESRVVVPIFPNDQNIPHLALKVESYLALHPDTRAYIIAGHGFYTWGKQLDDALRHVEALEFLFDLEIRLHGVRQS